MKKRQFRGIVVFVMSAAIILALTWLYWIIWRNYYAADIVEPFWTKGHWMMVAVYGALLCVFTRIYGAQSISTSRILDIIYSHTLSSLFTNTIIYFQICLLTHRFVTPVPMLILTGLGFLAIVVWAAVAKNVYRRIYPPQKLLVIYDDHNPDLFVRKLASRDDQYKVCELVNVSQGLDEICRMIHKFDGVVICDVHAGDRNELLKYCFRHMIRAYVTPKLSDVILTGAENSNILDSPMLICHNNGLRAEQKLAKRIFDLLIILPITVLTAPIMLISAIAIKVYDGGTVFYKQQRLTQNGRIFMIYKFRSMCMDSEKNGAQLARKGDSRITPIGRLLRATHLDELPQLINIIKGDMSIVGPRPERPEIAEQYREIIPEFDFRLQVKAGLTGYAQVFGKYNTTPYDKLKLDLYYIQHQSFLLDLELVLKTFKILFVKDNTEGIDANQTTAADPVSVKVEVKPADDGQCEQPQLCDSTKNTH